MKRILTIGLCLLAFQSYADIFSSAEIDLLKKNFLANINEEGAVVASPSQVYPNYYFDWIRDAAITMDLIETWYEKNHHLEDKQRLLNYIRWTEKVQNQVDPLPGQHILGEPKFYLNGLPFDGPWGRPQYDGPALRALTQMHFAQALLKENEIDYVNTHLYNTNPLSSTIGTIKTDLDFVATHWREDNFDLWEEVYGHHFFTEMVQRKALLEGAQFARQLHDESRANYYEAQAKQITEDLNSFIDKNNKIIQATRPPHPGRQKTLELDTSVILATLLGNTHDNVFAPSDEYIKNTATALKNQFQTYPINANHTDGILFGRYIDDIYDGYGDSEGNPWFILTATMAEYYYTLGTMMPNTALSTSYLKQGDNYLNLIKEYAPNLYISEQINRYTGQQQGAYSLTWSYVSVLRAIKVREQLNDMLIAN
ncbi:glycoside hydrolase family 15 protein [Legionella gresilensis]|uniref:glycoside hydrolase family 15 protein n=1 Tax=Legionella gresilensis TaxID=91823 RepID=UPI001041B897|nr:glycoside hydrolase family 15 protein [Legionella gresilensis]